jgi:hypothetical protein
MVLHHTKWHRLPGHDIQRVGDFCQQEYRRQRRRDGMSDMGDAMNPTTVSDQGRKASDSIPVKYRPAVPKVLSAPLGGSERSERGGFISWPFLILTQPETVSD